MNAVQPKLILRLFMTISGVFLGSFSVGIFNLAAFGVDPFQCFAQGAFHFSNFQMPYGTYYLILSLIMLIVIFLWDKHYISIATFINMFLTGYIVEYSYKIMLHLFPEPSIYLRVGLLIFAVILMCFGSSLYYTADLGVSVYDAISLILAKRKIQILKYNLPFKWIRVICDSICVVLGTLMGKLPGLGTIITAFFMGPLIAFFNSKLSEPLLKGKTRNQYQKFV